MADASTQAHAELPKSMGTPDVSPVESNSKVKKASDAYPKQLIVMVGLPARGKSYVTKMICRYMNWLDYDTQIFNVGDRRRKLAVPAPNNTSQSSPEMTDHSATFFDPDNEGASRLREQAAMETLDDLIEYLLLDGGALAIFDATNSTVKRREAIMTKVKKQGPEIQVMFLESLCFDKSLLESNMRLKLSGPDFKDKDPAASLADFRKRVEMYEKKYVALGEAEEAKGYAYCQMIDVGRKLVLHNISGFLPITIVHYIQHFNLLPRQIWLTRHGESEDDVKGIIGGNAKLTKHGLEYAATLSRFIAEQEKLWNEAQMQEGDSDHHFSPTLQRHTAADNRPKPFHIMTSTYQKSIQTAEHFDSTVYKIEHLRVLDELNAGVLEGLTRDAIKDFYSEWYNQRRADPFRFRYPGTAGEGYMDVTKRLKSVILEVERATGHVLLVSGLAVLRILLAYFTGHDRDEIVNMHVPLGQLHMLEPRPYGVVHQVYVYNKTTDWFDPL